MSTQGTKRERQDKLARINMRVQETFAETGGWTMHTLCDDDVDWLIAELEAALRSPGGGEDSIRYGGSSETCIETGLRQNPAGPCETTPTARQEDSRPTAATVNWSPAIETPRLGTARSDRREGIAQAPAPSTNEERRQWQENGAQWMLSAILASLKGYPNHGGDEAVMAEVDRIVKEAPAPDALRELAEAAKGLKRLWLVNGPSCEFCNHVAAKARDENNHDVNCPVIRLQKAIAKAQAPAHRSKKCTECHVILTAPQEIAGEGRLIAHEQHLFVEKCVKCIERDAIGEQAVRLLRMVTEECESDDEVGLLLDRAARAGMGTT